MKKKEKYKKGKREERAWNKKKKQKDKKTALESNHAKLAK